MNLHFEIVKAKGSRRTKLSYERSSFRNQNVGLFSFMALVVSGYRGQCSRFDGLFEMHIGLLLGKMRGDWTAFDELLFGRGGQRVDFPVNTDKRETF